MMNFRRKVDLQKVSTVSAEEKRVSACYFVSLLAKSELNPILKELSSKMRKLGLSNGNLKVKFKMK